MKHATAAPSPAFFQSMKMASWAVVVLGGFCLQAFAEDHDKPFDPRPLAGTYHFMETDSDGSATVKVRFRNAKEGEYGQWRAEGEMYDAIHGMEISFKGAFVSMKEDGTISVSAQFVGFDLKNKELKFHKAYQATLELKEEEQESGSGNAEPPKGAEKK